MWKEGAAVQREKRTYSGPLMEADFFPVFSDGRRVPTRLPKEKPSSEEQKKYNRLQATKKLIRLVNANFDGTDYLMHPTYTQSAAPETEKEARRDIVNYLRRVKARRETELKRVRAKLKELKAASATVPGFASLKEETQRLKAQLRKLRQPMKYIYVIERQTYRTGERKGKDNWHFHLFVTGGLDRGTMEKIWKKGVRTNCDSFQPETFGPEAAAKYMSKDPQGTKRFVRSQNLKLPKERTRDGAITKRGVEKLARERVDDAAYWERRYKGYKFLRCYARYNGYNGHWYVTVVMYRTEGDPPPWTAGEWITSDGA